MKFRALVPTALAAAIAFAQPVAFLAQEAGRAAEILAAARKAIGGTKLDAMKTFSVQSSVQRNAGSMQITSDLEVVLDLPDKYLRSETPPGSGGGMMVMAGGGVSGFNGDQSLMKPGGNGMTPGGGMVIRMGPGGPVGKENKEKASPEQLEQMNRTLVRNSQVEASRLMLGWFASAHPAAHVEYTYAGEAESPDGKAYVIDVKNADTFAARLFIDEQTHLPLMVTYKGSQPRIMTAGGPGPMQQTTQASGGGGHVVTRNLSEMSEEDRKTAVAGAEKQIQEMTKQAPVMVDFTLYFEDWRDADGVKFPFKIRRAVGGATSEEWTVNKIKVNPKVDPKRFATPTT